MRDCLGSACLSLRMPLQKVGYSLGSARVSWFSGKYGRRGARFDMENLEAKGLESVGTRSS